MKKSQDMGNQAIYIIPEEQEQDNRVKIELKC